jgi:hypothetical protein
MSFLTISLLEKVKAVSEAHPSLCQFGYISGVVSLDHRLDADEAISQIAVAAEYLSCVGKTKNWKARLKNSSYHLKHCCEKWAQLSGKPTYIGNGSLITAALILGFPVKPNGVNAFIGVRSRCDKWHLLPPLAGTW